MTLEMFDYVFTLSLIGCLSFSSVCQKAWQEGGKQGKGGPFPSKIWFFLYDILQVLANLYVSLKLWKLLKKDFFGFDTPNSPAFINAITFHYYTKWLDVGFTVLLLLNAKWRQLSFNHFFHHATIAPVWWYVIFNADRIGAGAIGFGAMINSFAHVFVYLHFAITSLGLKNPAKPLVQFLQLAQCTLGVAHSLYAFWHTDVIPLDLALLQLVYAANSMFLHTREIGSFHKTVHRSEEDHTTILKKPGDGRSFVKRGFVEKCIIRIHDVEYDATSFQERHPGGNIMSQYHNVDATDAFDAFHGDSEYAYKVLAKLPKVANPTIPKNPENLDPEWMAMIRKKYYGRTRDRVLFIIYAIGVMAAAYAGVMISTSWFSAPVIGGIILGVAWAHCGFVMHHAGHVAFTGTRSIDFIVQSVYFGLIVGASGRWWRNRHNKHHAMPNMVGVDGDLETSPFFAWDQKLARRCPTFLLKIQHYMFLPMLLTYSMVFFVSTKLFVYRKNHLDEMGLIVLHWALAFWLFQGYWWEMFVAYMVGYAIEGLYLGFFFGLNHFAEERIEDVNMSWVRWQCTASLNWGVGSYFYLILSGFLHLQAEHHIFPQMPPFAYPEAQVELQKYCKERNITYLEPMTFTEASKKLFQGMIDCTKEALEIRKAITKERLSKKEE